MFMAKAKRKREEGHIVCKCGIENYLFKTIIVSKTINEYFFSFKLESFNICPSSDLKFCNFSLLVNNRGREIKCSF